MERNTFECFIIETERNTCECFIVGMQRYTIMLKYYRDGKEYLFQHVNTQMTTATVDWDR